MQQEKVLKMVLMVLMLIPKVLMLLIQMLMLLIPKVMILQVVLEQQQKYSSLESPE